MVWIKLAISLLVAALISAEIQTDLYQVNDDQLATLAKESNYVLALFVEPNCAKCEIAKQEITKVVRDLSILLECKFVQLEAKHSQYFKTLPLGAPPTIVFWRFGNPAYYYGNLDAVTIAEFILEGRDETVAVELNDENHERHYAQMDNKAQVMDNPNRADWFILVCKLTSDSCKSIRPIWEGVGASLSVNMNVGQIDRDENPELAEKYSIQGDQPTFIFVRGDKVTSKLDLEISQKSIDGTTLLNFASKNAYQSPHKEQKRERNVSSYLGNKAPIFLKDRHVGLYMVGVFACFTLPASVILVAYYMRMNSPYYKHVNPYYSKTD